LVSSTIKHEKLKIIADCERKFQILNLLFLKTAVLGAPSEDVRLT